MNRRCFSLSNNWIHLHIDGVGNFGYKFGVCKGSGAKSFRGMDYGF